ncbi:MAG: aminotransferase class I/II-fold pyridoxal phosphate-dependent enzyme [Chlamydiota bacterium]|nr:aminotransferase class I/II-fold pyridoxal phosphate-dependent enzyme [Chlamydiota bacterium]
MKISKRVTQIPPSGIRAFFELVLGRPDVISLGVGEPDFDTPWTVRESAIYAIEKGRNSYTSNKGLIELRKAISEYLQSQYQMLYKAEDEILITVGVSEAMDLALRTILEPGDKVIIPDPCYVSYAPLTTLVGAEPILLSTLNNNFKIDPKALSVILKQKPKAIVLNYPSNPTGISYKYEELLAISELLAEHDTYIITDEIYDKLTFNYKHTPFPTLPGMKEKTIYLNGFSKAYAMTGWRIGYAAAPANVIEGMTKIHQYSMLCAPIQGQFAALEALQNAEEQTQEMKRSYVQRSRFLRSALDEIGLTSPSPDGAFYLFVNIMASKMESFAFAQELLQEENVAVVPGNAFGPSGEGYVRMSYATDIELLKEAVKRISAFLKRKTKHA